MKVHVEITDALQPIGAGVGAVLQVREVLRVLQQHEKRPSDLETKAVYLARKKAKANIFVFTDRKMYSFA